MQVKNFMNPHVVSVLPTTPLPKLWDIIAKKHLHALPIIDKNKKILGFIAKEDFLARLYPSYVEGEEIPTESDSDIEIITKLEKLKQMSAKDIMNTNIVFTRTDTNVMRALSLMIIRKVRQLPVLDEKDRVVGMLSKADVFAGLFKRKFKVSS